VKSGGVSPSTLERIAVPAGIVALVAILYWPVLGYPFLSLDDHYGVATNPGIRDLSLRGIRFLFFEDQRDWRYFPLAYLSFAVDHALFGLAPGAVHGTNLVLHLANTVLVFVLGRTLTRDSFAAAVASLLFGIHPIQVESVAWVSSRKTVLFFFFYLLSILAYVAHARAAPMQRTRSLAMLAASVLLFFLSITAKATAVTLPVVLLIVDAVLAREMPRRPVAFVLRNLPSKLLYLPAIVFVAGMTSRLAQKSPFGADVAFSLVDWIVIVGRNLSFYVVTALNPVHLGVFYPLPNATAPGLPPGYYALAALALALIGLCVWSFGRHRWIFFGTAWYLVTLLPSAVVPALLQDPPLVAADRYFYQSSVGLFLLAGLAASAGWRRLAGARRAALVLAAIAAILMLLGLAREQVHAFRGTIPLYERTVLHHPSDALYYLLALEYDASGQTDDAFRALASAESAPYRVFFSHVCVDQLRISDLYRRKGEFGKAARFLEAAVESTPNVIEASDARTPLAYRYIAHLYQLAGDGERAAALRSRADAARLDPRSYFESLWITTAPAAARRFLEERVTGAPDDAVAWFYLAQLERLEGRREQAEACLRKATSLGFRF
jgi:tetratricopeptide (TPR) repeat protein